MTPLIPPQAAPPTPTPTPVPPDQHWSGARLYQHLEEAVRWLIDRPWLAALAVTALFAYAAARSFLATKRHRHHAANAHLVTIAPPPEVNPVGARSLWANLAGILTPSRWKRLLYGTPHMVWQYTWAGRQLTISIWVPGTIPAATVEHAVRAAWPSASCVTTKATAPIPAAAVAVGGHLVPHAAEWLPLATDHAVDPLRALFGAGSAAGDSEYVAVQILARPARPRRVRRARRAASRLRAGKTATPHLNPAASLLWVMDLFRSGKPATGATAARSAADPFVQRDVKAIIDKVSAVPLWETAVRYAVAGTSTRPDATRKKRLRGLGDGAASAFGTFSARNGLGRRARMYAVPATMAARRLGAGFLANTPELAALAALPWDLSVAGLDRARAKAVAAPAGIASGGRGTKVLGDAEVDGHTVAMNATDARYHVHMVGTTGSGKSTLLANMVIDDVVAGRGTILIDPHGDLALDVLDRLPASVADRVVLFDPLQTNPPTLNPLEKGTDDDLTVDNIVAIFGAIFAKGWGPRMDDVMRVACLTLLRHDNVTLQMIPALLNNKQFRSQLTADLHGSAGLGGFWEWYDSMPDALRAQIIGPVLARLRSFLLRDFVAKTTSYATSSFDMADILDGGVLIVRIPKGVLGEDTSRLLGSLILARAWQAATARANIAPEDRRDCTIYLDEAQNFLTLSGGIGDMLAEARKYRLSLVLSHQDLAQFPAELLAAVSANARNKVFFTVAPEDSKVLAKHVEPELGSHDLAHLDAYTAVARLIVNGRQQPAFTLKTRPPRPMVGAAQLIRMTAEAKAPDQRHTEFAPVDLVPVPVEAVAPQRLQRPKGTRPQGE
ncbi:type IV secretory system conjugative DNA transfer family protein [Longispora urticae]